MKRNPESGIRNARKGSALLITLGVLSLLLVMGVTFAQLMRMDSQISTNYMHSTEAEFLAKAVMTY